MLFRNIKILDENFEIRDDMYVATEGENIAYISSTPPERSYGEEYDGKGKLLMPAFFNAHGHSPMSLLRGYAENMNLQDWLFTKVFPFEDRLSPDAVYYGTMLSLAEGLRFGIVSTSDMYYFTDDMVRAVRESGCKANISRAVTHLEYDDVWDSPQLKEMKRTFEEYNGIENGRVKMDVSIHAEYTSGPDEVKAVCEFGKSVGAIMHIHASETKLEHEECKSRRNGLTPIGYFESLGLMDMPVLAAHCIWAEDEDMHILKEKNATVASNPVSNMKLASGVCNVPELLRRGINVAIGTDSVCSNNSLNFFEEMKLFSIASKMYYGDPKAVRPKEALFAATHAGALAQGRDDSGIIKEGYRADLIVVDIDVANMYPIHNLTNNLVYSSSGTDVKLTMSDGRVLFRDGKYLTIDIEKTIYGVEKEVERILSELSK